jgi:hypothetical protein
MRRLVLTLVVLFVAYPFSLGPATWLEEHNYIPSALMWVYRPFWNIQVDSGPGYLLRQWELYWRNL